MMTRKIVMLGGKGVSTAIVYNALKEKFAIDHVILEDREKTSVFLSRRIRRLGLWVVLGQIAFQAIIVRALSLVSKKRVDEIKAMYQLDTTEIPITKVKKVKSINSEETIQMLKESLPDLIIVNGTRIISKKVISSVSCKLVNTHAGITPRYRGVHGAYWALVNNDSANCGTTIHFVDKGIDTGEVIDQKRVSLTPHDNFVTYPFLQLGAGIELLTKAIENYFRGDIMTKKGTQDSFLWYHPTIWFYLYKRITRGVK